MLQKDKIEIYSVKENFSKAKIFDSGHNITLLDFSPTIVLINGPKRQTILHMQATYLLMFVLNSLKIQVWYA